ncbi:phosphotransferase enzyme family protein [Heyndrickxia sp. NPDC080065]|uniref:phosphotransferase enzyme family protein n=1 Tax=Heyndrickxia sp. NPDC080065 TaxID=3390568 RepID=UPI003CFF3B4A
MLTKEIIFKHWGLMVSEIKQLSERAALLQSNDGSQWVIKRKMGEDAAKNELKLLIYLNKQKMKVPSPFLSINGDYFVNVEEEKYCLYSYLPGKVFSASESLQHPQLFGKTLAVLHKGMDQEKLEADFVKKDLYQMVYGWAVDQIGKVDDHIQLKTIFQEMEMELRDRVGNIKKQLIHRDAHFKNMVYFKEQEMGIIDFEIAEVNVRIFDLCYCATSVLNEIFLDKRLKEQWIHFVEKLVDTYHQNNPLSQLEYGSIWYVMLSIQAIFMAYFAHIPHLYKINKEMFLWIYEKKELICSLEESIG